MATPNNETSRRIGCLQEFCFNHFVEHRQPLSQELDELEQNRVSLQQVTDRPVDSLIQQVDQ